MDLVFVICRVLVMERLIGVPLTDLNSIRAVTGKDPEAVLVAALNTWFASVLGADTFHADVHAGINNSNNSGLCYQIVITHIFGFRLKSVEVCLSNAQP